MKNKFRIFKAYWNKYAALPILIIQITCWLIWGFMGCGISTLLWLFVPCGINSINEKRYLWYGRQLLFLTLAIANIYLGYLKI